MSRPPDDQGADTFDTVNRRFEQWDETRERKPYRRSRRPVEAKSAGTSDRSRYIFAAIGIGIGLTLLALALVAFYTAWQWNNVARDGATTGYLVVGFFLTIAGLGGVISSWNHNFRVLDPNRRSAPAHH